MKVKKVRVDVILTASIILNVVIFLVFLLSQHYSPLLMLLHIASLIVLWGLALQQGKIFEHLITKWKELLLIIFLLLIALFVRLYLVEEISPGMYGDELTVAT